MLVAIITGLVIDTPVDAVLADEGANEKEIGIGVELPDAAIIEVKTLASTVEDDGTTTTIDVEGALIVKELPGVTEDTEVGTTTTRVDEEPARVIELSGARDPEGVVAAAVEVVLAVPMLDRAEAKELAAEAIDPDEPAADAALLNALSKLESCNATEAEADAALVSVIGALVVRSG